MTVITAWALNKQVQTMGYERRCKTDRFLRQDLRENYRGHRGDGFQS